MKLRNIAGTAFVMLVLTLSATPPAANAQTSVPDRLSNMERRIQYLEKRVANQDTVIVEARYSAVFSNWIFFRRQLVRLGLHENKDVILDLSQTELVDHSVMEKLHELQIDFEQAGRRLELVGLEQHSPASDHPKAARRKNGAQVSAA